MNKFPDLKKLSHLSSTFFGIGLLPLAPGTWGSFAALFLFFGLIYVQISFLLYFIFCLFLIYTKDMVVTTYSLIIFMY